MGGSTSYRVCLYLSLLTNEPCVGIFDAVVPEMGPHICQETEAVVLILMAMLLLHRLYLATMVRLGNRLRSTSRHLEHKNYVGSPF
jgi:hypothetical protein